MHDDHMIEIAYFNRFHVLMTRGFRRYLCRLNYTDALCDPNIGILVWYLAEEFGIEAVRDELREIGEQAEFPFQESDLDFPERCCVRLALNAAHQIAIDEERARG